MKKFLQIIYNILFFVGFLAGYYAGELSNNILFSFSLLVGYFGLFALFASLFTPLLIALTFHPVKWIRFLKETGSHFLLNISVFGANGLFLFLWLNQIGTGPCSSSTFPANNFLNAQNKKKYTTEEYGLIFIEWKEKEEAIYFDDPFTKEPKTVDVCISEGLFGIDVVLSKKVGY